MNNTNTNSGTSKDRTGYNRFLLIVAGLGGLLYGVDIGRHLAIFQFTGSRLMDKFAECDESLHDPSWRRSTIFSISRVKESTRRVQFTLKFSNLK